MNCVSYFLVLIGTLTLLTKCASQTKHLPNEGFMPLSAVSECLMSQPELMAKAGSPGGFSVEKIDLICQNQQEVANLIFCIQDKFMAQVIQGKALSDIMPNNENWQSAIELVCQNKKEIFESKCINNVTDGISTCFNDKIELLKDRTEDLKEILCSSLSSMQTCVQKDQGTCSKGTISLMPQLVYKLFPKCQAPSNDSQSISKSTHEIALISLALLVLSWLG